MISLRITPQGGVQMLHDDALDLTELGSIEMIRASHVEFNNENQYWFVQSARSLKILATGFKTRAEALAWEKSFYSPDGAGWVELVGEK